MRTSILAFAAALLFACGSSSNMTTDGGPKDGSTTGKDGGTSAGDMATGMKTGCNGYIACLIDCGADSACGDDCEKNTTTSGRSKFQAAIACAQTWCLGEDDMGTGHCALNTDMTMLVDPPGSAKDTCSKCLNNSLAGLFGDTCMPTNDPDCNPSLCASTVTGCMASTP